MYIETSILSEILADKKKGSNALNNTSRGMKKLLRKECCLEFKNSELKYHKIKNCEPIEINYSEDHKVGKHSSLHLHREGRLRLEDKLHFLKLAQREIIEVGVSLNTFSQHFSSRRESEFKQPIHNLIKRGVNFKCYLLDPDKNKCKIFSNDRASIIDEDQDETSKIKSAIRRLAKIQREISDANYAGNFEIYLYNHLPTNYFLGIDLDQREIAKMMTATYLFGERRAKCPILEFSRKDEPILFQTYLDSLKRIIKDAKKIDPSNYLT